MKIGDTVRLTCDVNSMCKGLKLYGKKGDKVKITSIRGDVLIVEGKERFSVTKNKIENL
jgi:formylmethanofuran dehydrogenase subunit D